MLLEASEMLNIELCSTEGLAKEQLLEASASKTMMDFISVDKFSFQTEDALPSRPRFIGNSNSECLLQCLGYVNGHIVRFHLMFKGSIICNSEKI